MRVLQVGARDFISKPVDLIEIKTRIRNMLEVHLLDKKFEFPDQVLEGTVRVRTAELRGSQARCRNLAKLASDWHWEQDEAGMFTKVAGPVLEMLDLLDLMVQPMTEPSNEEGKLATGWNEEEHSFLWATITAREPYINFAFRRIKPDGFPHRFRVSGETIFIRDSRFIGYRGVGVESMSEILRGRHNIKPMLNTYAISNLVHGLLLLAMVNGSYASHQPKAHAQIVTMSELQSVHLSPYATM
jgi:PAS domain-containing protein